MSSKSSNVVRRERRRAAQIGTTLDRNGIPVLDPPGSANRLPKKCHDTRHEFVRVGRTLVRVDDVGETIYRVETRCRRCGESQRFQTAEA